MVQAQRRANSQSDSKLRLEAIAAVNHRAARFIQNVSRQLLARRFARLTRHSKTKSAITIQRIGRGRAARLRVRHIKALNALARLRRLVFPIGRVLRLSIEVRKRAVRRIERTWLQTKIRRYMARCVATGRSKSMMIQRLFRGYSARASYLATKVSLPHTLLSLLCVFSLPRTLLSLHFSLCVTPVFLVSDSLFVGL